MVNTDDVTGLKLVREAGSKCFNGQRDSNLTGRDAVERHIGRNRYRADLAGKDIVTHSQVGGSVKTIYIGELMGDVGGEVIAAYLNHLSIF